MNMKGVALRLARAGEAHLFHVLLLIPLIWYLLEDRQWPAYGIAALFIMSLKGEKPAARLTTESRVVGLLLAVSSFLTSLLKPFFGVEAMYTSLDYALYVAGLVIVFYGFSGVKHFLISICFLVAVSLFIHFSEVLEGFFFGLIPVLMYVVTALLSFSGISSNFQGDTLTLYGSRSFALRIVPSCAGIQSSFIFGTAIMIMFSDLRGPLWLKAGWASIGFLGTFLVNGIRIYLISLVGLYWSLSVVDLFHSVVGYLLFIPWLLMFEYIVLRSFQHQEGS